MLTIKRLGRRSFEVFRLGVPVGVVRLLRDTKMWGNFVYDHDPEQENEFNTLSAKVPIEQNRVVIFLSEQVHSVDPIEDDSIRISLAFNCFAKGNLGGRGHSSELIL